MSDELLDATGLICPLPVLRARKMLKALPAGAVLEVHADDPAAPNDFHQFCAAAGHALQADAVRDDGVFVFRIAKAGR